jgi:2'-5' RNA ligase
MSKLFFALPVAVDPSISDRVADLIVDPQTRPHLTLMWCGKDVSDEEVEVLKELWCGVFHGKFKERPKVTLLPEFALFGKDHNVMVLKSKVDEALEDAVNAARELSALRVKSIPPPDFKFSPHVTLGFGSTLLPADTTNLAGLGEQEAQDIVMYGEDYVVRGVIKWSDLV